MPHSRPVVVGVLTAVLLGATAFAQTPTPDRPAPHKPGVAVPLDYTGPERDDAEPAVSEVLIGWFGPGEPDHVEFGSMWRGALLAIEEENMARGYRPVRAMAAATFTPSPFRLVPVWSETPWKAGVGDLLKLVYEKQPWAVIGGVDGTTTHLAMQLALKSRFLLLSPGSTDVTADHGNVPWLFSLPPADTSLVRAIAERLEAGRIARFAVIASTDHASHATLVALRRELERRHLTPDHIVELDPSAAATADFGDSLHAVPQGPNGALVIVAPVVMTAAVVNSARQSGFTGAILGGPAAARTAFGRAAGASASGVHAPCAVARDGAWTSFAESYARRWHSEPDEAAAYGYDAVRLVAAAVRQAGLNRARIRDAVRALAPWQGASGDVRWDALGRNQQRVQLGRWSDGRFACEDVPRVR